MIKIVFNKNKKLSLDKFAGKEFEINNFKISRFILDQLVQKIGTIPYPLSEIGLLVSTVCFFQPELIFDWGTHVGKSAYIFYKTVKVFEIKSKIFSIDLPDNIEHPEHPYKLKGKLIKNMKKIKLIEGDGVTEALKIYKRFKKSKKSLFFLDGDHEYKNVKRELNLINKSVKKPIILIHDTFYQTKEAEYNIGPYKACSEFLKINKEYSEISTKLGLPGMTLLYKK